MRRLIAAVLAAGCLAAQAETKPYWLFVKTNGDKGYITDGQWKLKAQYKYSLVALGNSASWGSADANSYCWLEGEGDLDLSKPIYEVSSPDADPAGGTLRQMGEFPSKVFFQDSHVTSVVFPRRTKELYSYAFQECANLTNVVLQSDYNLSVFQTAVFKACPNLVSLTLDLPELTKVSSSEIFAKCPLSLTDASKWNLPKLESVPGDMFLYQDGKATYTVNGVTKTDDYPGPYGVVRLPSVKTIGSWAFARRSRIERFELGTDSLVSVGSSAFKRFRGTEIAMGLSPTEEVSFAADSLNEGVSGLALRIRFTGKAPSAAALGNFLSALDLISRANYYTILASSRKDPAFKTLGQPLTDVEKVSSPCDTLGVFALSGGQRCAWIVETAMPGDRLMVKSELDAPGWGVRLEAEPPADADGLVAAGSLVTLTVTNAPDAVGSFYRWYGDVGDGDRFSRSVTFRIGANDVWTMPVVDLPWTYDAEKGTIDNGDWAVYVNREDASLDDELRIGRADHVDGQASRGDAVARVGTGVLNLNGPITDADGKSWTIRRFGYAMTLTGASDDSLLSRHARSLVVPRTLNYSWYQTQYFNASSCPTLQTLVFDVTNAIVGAGLSTYFANGQRYLRNLVIRAPGFRFVRYEALLNVKSADIDVGDWYLPDVTNVNYDAFRDCERLRGTLALPKLAIVESNAFANCAALSGFVGGAPKKAQVLRIGSAAFSGCKALKTLELAASPSLDVSEDAFGACTPEDVTFPYLSPAASAVANILGSVVPSAGAKPCRIWGSVRVRNTTYADLADRNLTDEEVEAKPTDLPEGTEVYGVFRVAGDGEGLGRAWVMDRVGRYDQRGGLLQIR